MYLSWKISLIVVVVVGVASWSWQTAAREVESQQVLCIAEAEAEFAGGGAVPARVQRDGTRLRPSPVLIGADWRRTSVHRVSWRYIDQSQWNEQTQEKTRRQGLRTYCTVLSSAVRVFKISSPIEKLLQYLIWFKTSTIIWNTQGSLTEWCLSKNCYVYSAVVNKGPGPVSPWNVYIECPWPTKYWNSYNRNHNSAVL